MTKIGNSDGQQNRWAADYSPNENLDQQGRLPGRSGDGRNPVGAPSEWSPLHSTAGAGSVAAFQKSFHNAFRSLGDDAESSGDPGESELLAQASLLAIAEQGPQAGLPSPVTAEPPSSDGRMADIDAAVTAITSHIVRSIRADAGMAGQSFELNLLFSGDVAGDLGVTRISLSGTATALDVVLERVGSESSEQLRQAAKLLAERLMTRLGKRTVRVLELVGTGSPQPGEAVEVEDSAKFGES